MRATVILFLGTLGAAIGCPADVIHLKNGHTIWADHVRENGAHLEYDLGDNSYAIPKALVERVETGGLRPDSMSSPAGAKAAEDIPAFTPNGDLKRVAEISEKIVHDGQVDSDALAALEREGNAELTAAGYFLAARHEYAAGKFEPARRYAQTALRFQPDSPVLLNHYAVVLVRLGNTAEALSCAERSVRLAPGSPDSLTTLGFVQFAADRTRDALRSWKRSLALRADPAVEQYVARAEREVSAEADFSERESSHFTLHYEGQQTSEALRRALLDTLESQYEDLARALGAVPRGSIPVVLYTEQAFFDVTQAPSWTGAVNDGKLRIPLSGLTAVTPELARVLRHELAHSFINQMSAGRCPQWLHEGIAQVLEPKTVAARGRALGQLFRSQSAIPFNALEGSFMQFSSREAGLAYDESLAAAEYINDTYGISDLSRILQRIGQGSSPEAALRATIHSGYGQLESELARFLTRKYGE